MDDRRICPRWQVGQQAQISLEGEETPQPCILHDLNFKGARISLAKKMAVDSFLKVKIIFSEEFSLSAQVWVVWQRSIGEQNMHGVYFAQIADRDKEKMHQFVHKKVPRKITSQLWDGIEKTKGGEKMANGKGEDRRIFERLPVKLPVSFIGTGTASEGNASTQDISAKGIGLLFNARLAPRTPLEMWLKVPDKGEPLYTRGEVVWSEPQGPGQYRIGVNLEKADLMGLSRVLRVA